MNQVGRQQCDNRTVRGEPNHRSGNRTRRRTDARNRKSRQQMNRIVKRVGSHYLSMLTEIGWNAIDPDVAVKTIGLTSNFGGAGVSTIAAHTAMTAAINAGIRVLLIDANLIQPTVHTSFHCRNSPGITNVLRDGQLIRSAIQPTALENLCVLPIGDDRAAWRECGLVFDSVMKTLAADFQLVVVDLPSMHNGSHFLSWVAQLDAVLIVIASGTQSPEQARAVKNALRSSGVERMGVVLNRSQRDPLYRLHR